MLKISRTIKDIKVIKNILKEKCITKVQTYLIIFELEFIGIKYIHWYKILMEGLNSKLDQIEEIISLPKKKQSLFFRIMYREITNRKM